MSANTIQARTTSAMSGDARGGDTPGGETPHHVYRARLDFLYQSIAVYAVTMVIYLAVRSFGVTGTFPTLWQDPLMLLLSAIIVISVLALIYNMFMRRQVEVLANEVRFRSRAFDRSIPKREVVYVRFGSMTAEHNRRGIRVVRIKVRGQMRPVRIRLSNFEHSKELLGDLREWAGPLARTGRRRIIRRQDKNMPPSSSSGGSSSASSSSASSPSTGSPSASSPNVI